MKSITIHNLDDDLAMLIEDKAKELDTSQNKLIKQLLRDALGLGKPIRKKIDLSMIAGTLTEAEAQEFEENTSDLSTIDPIDWE